MERPSIAPQADPDIRSILDPLDALGVAAEDVTDVVLSHHHPDHTMNVALLANARVHDHWATYRGDLWWASDGPADDTPR